MCKKGNSGEGAMYTPLPAPRIGYAAALHVHVPT